jgi:cobaltochelatase CobN
MSRLRAGVRVLGKVLNRYTIATALVAVAGWWFWTRSVAPTHVAVVNFRDFQLNDMLEANDSKWVTLESIDLKELPRKPLGRFAAIYIFGRGLNLESEHLAALRRALAAGSKLYVVAATNAANDLTNLSGDDLKYVADYFDNGGRKNLSALWNYTRRAIDGKTLFTTAIAPPQKIPSDSLFHIGEDAFFPTVAEYEAYRDAHGLSKKGRPRVALVTSIFGPRSAHRGYLDDLIRAIEARDINVYPISGILKRLDYIKEIQPDLVVYNPHGRMAPGRADEAIAYLHEQGIPLLCPVDVFQNYDQWIADQKGMQGGMMSQNIVMPELDGGIEPYAISAQFPNDRGLNVPRAIPGRLETFVDRVEKWLTLKSRPNADKKVAIVYLKDPGQGAMVAAGMEVAPSLLNLLRRLKAAGYTTGELPPTVETFEALIKRQGNVLGPYARGAFEEFLKSGNPELVKASDYLGWVKAQLHPDLYRDVERTYGPPPGEYLATRPGGVGHIAVPRITFGNVVLLPQLLPAVGSDSNKLVHGVKQPPPHPYIATYLWARHGFKADALIHFGTHGSLEFTPWKQNTLSPLDWSDALIGDLPHLYVYVINNIGEAVIAKRRSYAAISSHLTPPFTEAELHGPLKRLLDTVTQYTNTTDPLLRQELEKTIHQLVLQENLYKDLKFEISEGARLTGDQIEALHEYLFHVAHEKVTRGLYTLGEPYSPGRAAETARLMAIDPVAVGRAKLDIAKGKADPAILDKVAEFNAAYRDPAARDLQAILDGRARPESFVDHADLARLQRWADEHATMSDDEMFANMVRLGQGGAGRGGPAQGASAGGRGGTGRRRRGDRVATGKEKAEANEKASASGVGPAQEARIRALLASIAVDPVKLEFLNFLRTESNYQRTAASLDPESLQKAKKIAAMIPAMKKALDTFEQPDVFELVGLMQPSAARRRVFELLDDPSLRPELEAEAARLKAEAIGKLLSPPVKSAVFAVFEPRPLGDRLKGLRDDELKAFRGNLAFAIERAPLADDLEATPTPDVGPLAAILRSSGSIEKLRQSVDACDRESQARIEAERQYCLAVKTLRDALFSVAAYKAAIEQSTDREAQAILAALGGKYIAPSPGGDAITNPDAVPTGRNLVAIDAERTPSVEAVRVAEKLARATVDAKLKETGRYPKKIAMTLWAGDFINSQGVDIAMALYFLGVEPLRDSRGVVHDVKLIPAERLGRPRIDVVVQTSGQFRDIAATRMYLIDKAVRLASAANDADSFENHVREGTLAAERVLKQKGMSPADARKFATARVFGGVNGNYGSGIMGLVESGDRWEKDTEIAETYLNNMGAIYTEDHWASYSAGLFEAALQNTDTLLHSRTSNQNGPLSLDHVYEFMGGFSSVIRHVTGKDPDAYFADMRNKNLPRMQEAREAIWVEARSTLLNPKYIKDLQQGGSSSASVFAESLRNTYGWNVMRPTAIDDELWDELHEVYVRDKHGLGIQSFFREKNPYALQEMTAVMLESARKGLWAASPEQLKEIAQLHVGLVQEYRPGCSGFVCDNGKLREYIGQQVGEARRAEYALAISEIRSGQGGSGRTKGLVLEKQESPRDEVGPESSHSPRSVVPRLPNAAAPVTLAVLVIGGLIALTYGRRKSQ